MTGSPEDPREALFDAALELPSAQRAEFLRARCGADADLLEDLLSLVRAHETAGTFLDGPAVGRGAADPTADLIGRSLGGFEIERLLAQGGMGSVYVARQSEPRRAVALKVLRAPTHASTSPTRFRREIEILGRLRHPGIARVFAGGVESVDGVQVPYMALELVPGAVPLVEFARSRETPARLHLFLQACDAVHHAHLRGIVHRDLKPANLLVDERGTVQVIDFGIARLLDPEPASIAAGPATRAGELFGTLAYMSPEQCDDSADLDVRTDVYSLGLVLYELLAGRPAYDLDGLSVTAALTRRLADPEPLRRVAPHQPADLCAIVATALARDPEARYGSVAALADDLRRYLRHQPTVARPPGAWRTALLFVRRHAVLTATTSLVVATLAVATVYSLAQKRHAEEASAARLDQLEATRLAQAETARQLERAEAESAARKKTLDVMLEIFTSDTPDHARGEEVRVRDLMDHVAARIVELSVNPRVDAMLHYHYGRLASAMARPDLARSMLVRALEVGRQVPLEPGLLGRIAQALARTAARTNPKAAIALFRESLDHFARAVDEPASVVHDIEVELAQSLLAANETAAAQEILDRVAPLLESAEPGSPITLSVCCDGLARLALGRGDLDAARDLWSRAVDVLEPLGRTTHLARALGRRGLGHKHAGEFDAALRDYDRALELQVALLPEADEVGLLQSYIARVHVARRARTEALTWQERAIESFARSFGPESFQTVNLQFGMVADRIAVEAFSEAEALARKILPLQRKLMTPTHPSVAVTLDRLAACLDHRGATDEAADQRRAAAAIRDEAGRGR